MNDFLMELDNIGAETAAAVERFMNDEQKYLKYVRNFPEEGSMPALETAMSIKDYAGAKVSAHALKGIVSNLGFTPLTDAVVDLYAELLDGNTEDAITEYQNVRKQYRKFCDTILSWRDKATPAADATS